MSTHSLLLVEDDEAFARTLKRSLERRGYTVQHANNLAECVALLDGFTPTRAVVDLKLGQESGLAVVRTLHERLPDLLIVVLTGFASIATAVEAIKLGACNYLVKPSNTDDIDAAFAGEASLWHAEPAAASPPPRSKRWRWSASTRCWRRQASISPRPRGGSACTGGLWRASWLSAGCLSGSDLRDHPAPAGHPSKGGESTAIPLLRRGGRRSLTGFGMHWRTVAR